MCVYMVLWYQLGALQFQLNSDTLYLEIVSDPTGEGLSPTRLSPHNVAHL